MTFIKAVVVGLICFPAWVLACAASLGGDSRLETWMLTRLVRRKRGSVDNS